MVAGKGPLLDTVISEDTCIFWDDYQVLFTWISFLVFFAIFRTTTPISDSTERRHVSRLADNEYTSYYLRC